MVCATGRESRSGPIEDPPNFLESQQITIKTKRLLQIFHIKDDMAQVMRFHILIPREILRVTRDTFSMNRRPVDLDEIHGALVEGHIVVIAVGRDRESLPLIISPCEVGW